MSSEPEGFPIEDAILPIVYALNCLGVCRPYWSCEGHDDPQGNLHKLPRVWFYARSTAFPRLINDFLTDLNAAGALTSRWHVCLTYSAPENPDTGFSLEPNISPGDHPSLKLLHADIAAIGNEMSSGVKKSANDFLARTNGQRPGSLTFISMPPEA